VRYLDRFHLFTVLTTFSPAKTRVEIDSRTLPSQINTIVTDNTLSGDGWLLGGGGYFDPCLDRNANRIVIIMFIIFGALLALVVADGLRRACCRRSWHQQPGMQPHWHMLPAAYCLLLHTGRCLLLCAATCCAQLHTAVPRCPLPAARTCNRYACTTRMPSSSPAQPAPPC
jgi:hypothetical protein